MNSFSLALKEKKEKPGIKVGAPPKKQNKKLETCFLFSFALMCFFKPELYTAVAKLVFFSFSLKDFSNLTQLKQTQPNSIQLI